jgi:hypothetical protein
LAAACHRGAAAKPSAGEALPASRRAQHH